MHIMNAQKNKLDFEKPPVEEVVLSIVFDSLPKLLAPHLGEIWQEFKKDGFTDVKEHPAIPAKVETFRSHLQARDLEINVPDLPRVWFVHKDDNQIIQVQRDRFTYNWRKIEPNHQYPGFPQIYNKFEDLYNRFRQTLEELQIGPIKPLQYELTYMDRLMHEDAWRTLNDIGQIYNIFVNPQQLNSFWSDPEFLDLRASFLVPELKGRLYLAIRNRIRTADQKQTLQTDFTLRGLPKDTANARKVWFEAARNQITEKFALLFTERIQTEVWKRKV